MPRNLALRLPPPESQHLVDALRALGELYRHLSNVEGGSINTTTITLPERTFDTLFHHISTYCDANQFIGDAGNINSIVWNGIELKRAVPSQFREVFNFIRKTDINEGYSREPKLGEFYDGMRINRIFENDVGYDIYCLVPIDEDRNRNVTGRWEVDTWEGPVGGNAVPRINNRYMNAQPIPDAIPIAAIAPGGQLTRQQATRVRRALEQFVPAVPPPPAEVDPVHVNYAPLEQRLIVTYDEQIVPDEDAQPNPQVD